MNLYHTVTKSVTKRDNLQRGVKINLHLNRCKWRQNYPSAR